MAEPLTLDLFGGDFSPAPAPLIELPPVAPPEYIMTHEWEAFGGTTFCADEPRPVFGHPRPFDRPQSINPDLLAFVAQARRHGHTDPCLDPVAITEGGRRLFDEREVIRFANELLRGVRSDKPAMTSERWSQAIQKARRLEAADAPREVAP